MALSTAISDLPRMARETGITTLERRQLWGPRPFTSNNQAPPQCTPITLTASGVLSFADQLVTLTTNVVFQPACTGASAQDISTANGEPFYASVIPQTYVVAATTVIAWILVIMLVITPRTNFIGGAGSSSGLIRGHGIIGGASGGGTNLIGVGSRPWLQKAAALTVAIALTIATADTFEAAQAQYDAGYMSADDLRQAVLESMEIRITRVISDVFVWLAQVQTLVRLFPRHKEKVLIKWIGFALIVFDSVFSCLNSFLVNSTTTRPRSFSDAIPALSYLFELALGLLYAAWVIYYAMTKRRYAFYHPKMSSISLIAMLSLVAILTPVVFFVTDVSNPDVAVWGDYFRWVGAAAASVVVWEWVERIEALERDEKKDGILGREVFDGDEMLDMSTNSQMVWSPSSRSKYKDGSSDGSNDQAKNTSMDPHRLTNRFRHRQQQLVHHFPLGRAHSATTKSTPEPGQSFRRNERGHFGRPPRISAAHNNILGVPTPPPPVASPINRGDTSSAGSTVYVVRYDASSGNPAARQQAIINAHNNAVANRTSNQQARAEADKVENDEAETNQHRSTDKWYTVSNPFKRKRACLPAEVQQAREAAAAAAGRTLTPAQKTRGFGFRGRLKLQTDPTTTASDSPTIPVPNRLSAANTPPIIVIPAQRRGAAVQSQEEDRADTVRVSASDSTISEVSPHVSASTTLTANSQFHQTTAHRWEQSQHDHIDRQDHSPLGAGGTSMNGSLSSSRPSPELLRSRTFSAPPRADDISPTGGETAIIPAPRRSPLRRMDNSTNSVLTIGANDSRNTRGTGS